VADNQPGAVQRSLEGGGNLFINKFWTGLYRNRSPLFTPISVLGIQLIARQDALWDGVNMMVTPQFTLRRRYGFLRSCSVALGTGEWPLTYFSHENLNGTIWPLVDTQDRVATFSGSAIGTLFNKLPGAGQSSFETVDDILYWVDGVSAMKFVGPNLLVQSNTFATTPWTKSDATLTAGQTDPLGGSTAFQAVFSSASGSAYLAQASIVPNYTPVASNTFAFSVWMRSNVPGSTIFLKVLDQSGTLIETQQTLTTSWARYSVIANTNSLSSSLTVNIINPSSTSAEYFVYDVQLEPGGVVTPDQITTAQPQGVYLMGIIAAATAPTLSYVPNGTLSPLIGYQYGYCYLNAETGTLSTMSPASANTGPLSNKTVTQNVTIPASGPYTVTVTNGATYLADQGVVYASNSLPLTAVSGAPTAGQYDAGAYQTGTYTFAAADAGKVVRITYTYSLVGSTGVNVNVSGSYSPDPQVSTVQIYRTDDGGAEYYLDTTIPNVVGSGTWSYEDSTVDADLNDDIIAPVADVNNPPATGMSLLLWYGGRLWGMSGNTAYFSMGPDNTNGVGTEAWPPGNNYAVPGKINAAIATSSGQILFTKDDAYTLTGNSTATYTTPLLWQSNWGVRTPNCVCQDGDNLFIFTSRSQVFNYNGALAELGYTEESSFGALDPYSVYIAVHRSGADEGVFVSDGSANLFRYSQLTQSWDTVSQPVGGINAIASIENADGTWELFMGRPTGSGYILNRDASGATYTDDGQTYPLWTTIGSITVAPPRQVANVESILLQVTGIGTYPSLAVMCNEIVDSGKLPVTFVTLPNPKPDPPQMIPSQSVWTRRHDFKAAQSPLPSHVQHLQIKVTFPSEAQPNEILGVGIAHKGL
jgi:hypothetical protein